MKKVFTWIAIGAVVLIIVGFLFVGRSDRQAYRIAKGAVEQTTQMRQERIDLAVEMATKSVDLALAMAGDLPSQQAAADLVKQDIEEIGSRLDEAAQLRGDLAIEKLNASIEQFDQTMEAVDQASQEADTPAVKSIFDRIYGVLAGTKEQLVQAVLNTQE